MLVLHPPGSLVLDGRTFRSTDTEPEGTVGPSTRFDYHEDDDGVVWARYAGGDVVLGHLTGRRDGQRLDFRYTHLETSGETAAGACSTVIEGLDDGRLRLNETWAWDSRDGTGTSTVEETIELQDDRLEVELAVQSGDVVIRPLRMTDAADVASVSADDDIHRYTFITRPLTLEESQHRAGRAERWRRAGSGVRLAVIEAASGRFIGETGVSFDHVDRSAEIYYWLAREERGRGLGTDVLRRVASWLADSFDLGRLELTTHVENIASQRIAAKVGFREEGVIRNGLFIDDAHEDVKLFGMLPTELIR